MGKFDHPQSRMTWVGHDEPNEAGQSGGNDCLSLASLILFCSHSNFLPCPRPTSDTRIVFTIIKTHQDKAARTCLVKTN